MAKAPAHTILLMRHPQTPANTEHFFSGRLDIDITPAGEKMDVRRPLKQELGEEHQGAEHRKNDQFF